ncbi:porin [Hydrogenophaga sp.]|uniref:porin n=1 Tax=Hydrogenophaga sp. TaxID=1904254 RepID=UPI0027285864|nr:porin [Hydrogenophaga sp.]MDO9436660.1 porin [Hydrogenophaga sp.]
MKKTSQRSLLLGAALGLSAIGAQAQSSVQVFGGIDMSFGSTKAPGGTSITGVDSGKMTTSHYGFTGTEDLGGGLSAQFRIEGFFRGDSGAAGRFNGDAVYSRATVVGLSHKSFGSLNLGRQGTQLFVSTLLFNAFGDSFGYSPSIRHYFSSGAGSVTGDTGWNDSVNYASPNLGGFRFGTSWASKESAAGVGNGGNWSVGLSYGSGPFAASLVHQSAKKDAAVPLDDTKTTQFGASYDFSVAKAFLQYGEIKNTTTNNKTDIIGIGARVPFGQGAFQAQYGTMDVRFGADRKTLSLGYVYNLSRRTNLYAVVMSDKLDGLSSGGGYSLGMRHSF